MYYAIIKDYAKQFIKNVTITEDKLHHISIYIYQRYTRVDTNTHARMHSYTYTHSASVASRE